MTKRYDCVVIGSGGLGASTALHLAKLGRSVALIDMHSLGSQTSPRAAGLACQIKDDLLQGEISRRSVEKLVDFEAEMGVALACHQAGSIRLARDERHARDVRRDVELGERDGVEVHLISSVEVGELAPYFRSEGVRAASFVPSDLYLEPKDLVGAYIEACCAAGVSTYPHTTVVELVQRRGEIATIKTTAGDFEAGEVVDAGGAWMGAIASLVGFEVPMVPVRHQLLVTEEVRGVTNAQAAVRITDDGLYCRPDRGGLMFGGYEKNPERIDVDAWPDRFDIGDLRLDFAPLQELAERAAGSIPALSDIAIREFRGGVPTVTADGRWIIDRIPGLANFYVIGGCNVAGLTTSPAIGELVAQRIAGTPSEVDLSSCSLSRFDSRPLEKLEANALWRYSNQPRG
jgi:glycine/D-amino acid oxidase-like deaminating enzyme